MSTGASRQTRLAAFAEAANAVGIPKARRKKLLERLVGRHMRRGAFNSVKIIGEYKRQKRG